MIKLIGFVAAILTTVAFLPQVIKSWQTKKLNDISLLMYSLLTTGIFLWLLYGIFTRDLPLIFANLITFVLAASVLILKIKHRS